MKLDLPLPKINDPESYRNQIEQVLISVREQIEETYPDRLSLLITTSSSNSQPDEKVLTYSIYLVFNRRHGFSYRLFELKCVQTDGGLPVEVNAFSAPTKPFGIAVTIEELNKKIEEIFAHPRTREIILANY
ncbi:MAG TPA: hypothetical protein VGS79_14410 [Puia sp.]|nr:hypothetical protein [Puia sp.]